MDGCCIVQHPCFHGFDLKVIEDRAKLDETIMTRELGAFVEKIHSSLVVRRIQEVMDTPLGLL